MSACGPVLLTILITPPPTNFLYFTSARSGSIPVVSQSIMKPMVPVGARTVTCAVRYPAFSPWERASSQQALAASIRGLRDAGEDACVTAGETPALPVPLMLLTEA